ncbi:hypothetical protein ACE3MS_27190 [Paenibacillus dendritiformis]|uniref:hypothetical protein n=1 Tax=Paenibacillus dendritiformis TaxID=130049 RepID=UPI00366659EB
MPGLIPLHFYPHDHIEEDLHAELAAPLGLPLHRYRRILEEFMGISPNPVYLRDMLAQEMRLLAEQELSDKELVLMDWNRELTNDTVYKAAYLGKAIVFDLERPRMRALCAARFYKLLFL